MYCTSFSYVLLRLIRFCFFLPAAPRLIGPQREKPGFFPAYHMNKEHWITAALDGSAPEDEIKILLAMSYDLTAMTRAFRKNTILP